MPFAGNRLHRGAWLSFGVLAAAVATAAWQHAALGMPLSDRGRAAAMTETVAPAPAGATDIRPRPSQVLIDVPFSPQAPLGNWSPPYDEACEEASLAMAMAWAKGEALTPQRTNAEILKLIAFENYHFGYNDDTALRETAKLIRHYYRHAGAEVRYDMTLNDMRAALAAGNILIVPAAGALLQNPHYIGPPPYHMLVVRGYDDAAGEFIVNDPGTRLGQAFRYPYPILWNAIHDWTGSDATITAGSKGMIVVARESAVAGWRQADARPGR